MRAFSNNVQSIGIIMRTTQAITVIAAFLVASVALAPAALAQAPAAENTEAKPASAKPSPEEIAKLDECRALANSSKRLRGQVKNDLRAEMQQDDANMTMRNKRHVVMAYAALWILAVGFLVLLFLRQRGLSSEISRLKREVATAVADEEQE